MDDEAFVQAHQVADKRLLQQVVANGDTWRRQSGVIDRIVDERRVHDDIAVIGQKQIGHAGLELLDAGIGHTIGGTLDRMIDIMLDFVLQGRDRIDTGKLTAQLARDGRLKDPAQRAGQSWKTEMRENREERLVTEQPVEYGFYFGVVVRSDGIEFAHHALLLETARVKVGRVRRDAWMSRNKARPANKSAIIRKTALGDCDARNTTCSPL